MEERVFTDGRPGVCQHGAVPGVEPLAQRRGLRRARRRSQRTQRWVEGMEDVMIWEYGARDIDTKYFNMHVMYLVIILTS